MTKDRARFFVMWQRCGDDPRQQHWKCLQCNAVTSGKGRKVRETLIHTAGCEVGKIENRNL